MKKVVSMTKRLSRVIISLALLYFGLFCLLLLVPESFFLRAGGVPLSKVDWYYRNSDMSYYLLDYHENETVDFIRFCSATKWLPPNVLVKRDCLRYNLDRQKYEIFNGWKDARQETDSNKEGICVSVPIHGVIGNNFADSTLLLEILSKDDGMSARSDYVQEIQLDDGRRVTVKITMLYE